MRETYRQLLDQAESDHARPGQALRSIRDRAPARPLRLQLAGVAVGVAVMLGLFMMMRAQVAANERAEEAAQLEALLDVCRTMSDPEGTPDWDRGAQACAATLELAPANAEAQRHAQRCALERVQQRHYDLGLQLAAQGRALEAMAELLKIEQRSHYAALAKARFRAVAEAAQREASGRCAEAWRAQQAKAAWPDCRTFADLGSYLGNLDAPELREARQAFETLRARQVVAWQPRVDLALYLGPVAPPSDARAAAIRQKYADPALAACVIQYATDPVAGLSSTQRLLAMGGPAEAKQAFQHMETAYSKAQLGQERLVVGDLKSAIANIGLSVQADAALMPPGYLSNRARALRQDMLARMKDEYLQWYVAKPFPAKAFGLCTALAEAFSDDALGRKCLSHLEEQASDEAEASCEGAREAVAITQADRPAHQRAEAYLRQHCP